jgi:aminodeoxyfutalosine deaminase
MPRKDRVQRAMSDMSPTRRRFQGDLTGAWLYTGERLIPGGGVRVLNGRIERLLGPGEARDAFHLPQGLLHPGLVNAHAHLDLFGLSGRLPSGSPFTDWLAGVRALRAGRTAEDLAQAACEGLAELVRTGTTAVADFSFAAASERALAQWPVRGLLLREVIGFGRERGLEELGRASEWLAGQRAEGRLRHGLGPHAPYSAHAELIRGCHALLAGRPLAIHTAEDPVEALFLETGGGPLRSFLESVGVRLDGFTHPGRRPVGYLADLGVLDPSTLLIHGNDIDQEEIATLAASGAAVVFCPGTHQYFNRPPHPLPRLLAAGVPVGLGTDSSVSNRGFSMAAEMRQVRSLFPELPADVVFGLGTGRFLARIFPGAGQLAEGGDADLAVAGLGGAGVIGSPLECFLREDLPNLLTLAAGQIVLDHSQ